MQTKLLYYPCDWPDIARAVKEAANWRCQVCGAACPRLAVAHLSQDYEAEAVTVAALCVRCHLIYDAPHSWLARQRWARQRRHEAGQLQLIAR